MLKRVGMCVYAHKSNFTELYNSLEPYKDCQELLTYVLSNNKYAYDIIKVNKQNKTVSLIECETWDILNEPIVGDSHCYRVENGKIFEKLIKGGTKVYHNKWQFVSDNYTGFDIAVAKERTKEWNNIPNILLMKSKIGNKDYWYKLLESNGLNL